MKVLATIFAASYVILLSDGVDARTRVLRQGEWDDFQPWWQDFPPGPPNDFPPRPQPQRPPRPTRTTRRPGRTTTPFDDGATPAVVDGNGSLLGCDCPAPPQFNPVCGNDGVTYGNLEKLDCARSCGRNVRLSHVGACLAG